MRSWKDTVTTNLCFKVTKRPKKTTEQPTIAGNKIQTNGEIIGPRNSKISRIVAKSLNISQGGTWKPPKCTPRHKSVLLVPYRDRPEHLEKFLLLLHPFLQAQKLNYAVVVVEQEGGAQFNRAKLFNVGFSEAVAAGMVGLGTCLIFHDVDLVRTNFPRDLKGYSQIHSWARTPRNSRAREGGVYYIKFVCYYNGIRRLGGV